MLSAILVKTCALKKISNIFLFGRKFYFWRDHEKTVYMRVCTISNWKTKILGDSGKKAEFGKKVIQNSIKKLY